MLSLRLKITLLLLIPLAGCGGAGPQPNQYSAASPVDFSGSWEIDYARSDNIQRRFDTLIRQARQEAERRARAAERGYSTSGPHLGSGKQLLALAEMAELITAPELLDVFQTETEVRVKRENSFALICRVDETPPAITETPFGVEYCGWDGHQLFFDIHLPEGLVIRHRLTRAALADSLVIQTAVYSPAVAQPFVINKVFNRYNPGNAGYHCTQTLTKGRVCTTEPREP